MKKSRIIFIAVCFLFKLAVAQTNGSVSAKKRRRYGIFTIGANQLLSQKNNGALNLSFPYTITPVSGTAHDTVFTANPLSPFQTLKSVAIPLNFEWGNLYHFWSFALAMHTVDWGVFISLGYGHNYYLNLFGKQNANLKERKIVVKPSINIGYNSFPPNKKFGSIDNVNKNITVLGKTSGPTFESSSSDENSTTSDTYNTQSLDVSYRQNTLLVIPQIAFSNNQYKHKIHWEINIAYYLPLYEKSGIALTQTDGDNENLLHTFKLGTNGLNTTFNNQPIAKTPFQFSGLKVGIALGFSNIKQQRKENDAPVDLNSNRNNN